MYVYMYIYMCVDVGRWVWQSCAYLLTSPLRYNGKPDIDGRRKQKPLVPFDELDYTQQGKVQFLLVFLVSIMASSIIIEFFTMYA